MSKAMTGEVHFRGLLTLTFEKHLQMMFPAQVSAMMASAENLWGKIPSPVTWQSKYWNEPPCSQLNKLDQTHFVNLLKTMMGIIRPKAKGRLDL